MVESKCNRCRLELDPNHTTRGKLVQSETICFREAELSNSYTNDFSIVKLKKNQSLIVPTLKGKRNLVIVSFELIDNVD